MEAKLRRALYDSKQLTMVKTAQDDTIAALRAELSSLEDERDVAIKLASYGHLPEDLERCKKIAAEKEEEAKEAVEKKEEAEADVLKQLDSSQALLEKLLKEQREGLSSELKNTKKELAAEQESKP